jgi:hypothetical protein
MNRNKNETPVDPKLQVGKIYENTLDEEMVRITEVADSTVRYEVIQGPNGAGGQAIMLKSFAERNLIPI